MCSYDISKSYDHPLFLDELPTSSTNDAIEALKLIHSENETPESIAMHYNDLAKEYLTDRYSGYLKNALSCYTKGIESDPNDTKLLSILYSNRAFIYIKLGKFVESVTDCKKAIELDPNNSKGYYRGASGSVKLGLYKQGLHFCQLYIDKFGNITDTAFLSLYNEILSTIKTKRSNEYCVSHNEHKKVINVPYSLPEGVDCVNYTRDGVLHFSSLFIYDEIGVIDYISDMSDTDTLQMHLDVMFKDNNFEGMKFDKNVVAYLEIPGDKLIHINTSTQICKALKGVTGRYDVLPVHILKDQNNNDKLEKLLGHFSIIG